MIAKKSLIITTLLALSVSFAALADKPIYKWKDSQGNIKYTQNKPPRGTDFETIYQRQSSNSSDSISQDLESDTPESSNFAEREANIAEQQAKIDQVEQQNEKIREQNCKIAKTNAKSLEQSQNVIAIIDGKETMLAGEDRIKRLNVAKDNIAKYCK
ncbi:DUF4124 domain-containing protein [Kangiella marina]|uniref:DUF4124 domain-containing protein n=1 Tax=Kangiella marina TaxID=1079178 RepID=A0ABP8IPX5_9GAMM